MIKKNKKGISAVVATVLIILITIAAVGIIWTAVIPMIRNQISGGTVCLDADVAVELGNNPSYTFKNSTGVQVQVRKTSAGTSDFELSSVKVKFYDTTGNSYSKDFSSVPATNEDKVQFFTYSSIGTDLDKDDIEKVSIIPVVVAGQSTKECKETEPYTLTTKS